MPTDPRAALAECISEAADRAGVKASVLIPLLAERGVLLVTEERLAAAYFRVLDGPVLDSDDQVAAAIFAALSAPAE